MRKVVAMDIDVAVDVDDDVKLDDDGDVLTV